MENGVNTTFSAEQEHAAESPRTTSWRHRLCKVIDPAGFFNADASREIDRLIVEKEALREELVALKRILDARPA